MGSGSRISTITPRPSSAISRIDDSISPPRPLLALAQHIGEDVDGMHAHQTGPGVRRIALHQRDMLRHRHLVDVDDAAEVAAIDAVERGLAACRSTMRVVAPAIGDQVGDGADLQAVALGEGDQVGRRAIVPSSFMISQITPAGFRPGQPREIDRRLGVAGAHQHAAVARHQREDVAGRDDVAAALATGSIATAMVRARSAAEMPVVTPSRASIETVKAVLHGACRCSAAISGRPSCCDALARSAPGRSGRAPCLAMKLIASGVAHLRRNDEVALVLAILVVDQDEHPARCGRPR